MHRYAAFVLFLTFGSVFHQSCGVKVAVKDKEDKLCLFADLMVNFTVSYEAAGNESATAEFELPDQVTTNGSECGASSSLMKLNFGEGHSWSVNFSASGKTYQAGSIVFTYNLSDAALFPKSASNGTVSLTVKPRIADVGVDTCYSCKSTDVIQSENVNQTLWNVLMQAFVSNGSQSENITSCAADTPTTVSPTTIPTTEAPVTNITSTTPVTTAVPTPVPTLPPPATGNYSIKPEDNSTACLLARFGLRIGLTQANKYQEMNLDPNGTTASGLCGGDSSELVLTSNAMTIAFTFAVANDTKKFRLHALNVTGKTSSGVAFSEANVNLSLWEAALSSSYMCNKEQNYSISSRLSLYTFNLWVQPFGVKNGNFSTAEDCQADAAESFIVPIAVGVALVVLILIVLLAYFIGRKRNMASGYESF